MTDPISPLLHYEILHLSRLKGFADTKINVTQNLISILFAKPMFLGVYFIQPLSVHVSVCPSFCLYNIDISVSPSLPTYSFVMPCIDG